jgi:hypothetical protein
MTENSDCAKRGMVVEDSEQKLLQQKKNLQYSALKSRSLTFLNQKQAVALLWKAIRKSSQVGCGQASGVGTETADVATPNNGPQ